MLRLSIRSPKHIVLCGTSVLFLLHVSFVSLSRLAALFIYWPEASSRIDYFHFLSFPHFYLMVV